MSYFPDNDAFKHFLHKEFAFYGAVNNCVKLDSFVFEVIENPDDGHRSCLGSIIHKGDTSKCGPFYRKPLATVKIVQVREEYFEGYDIIDAFADHRWVRAGTETFDDYYPGFIFTYTPLDRRTYRPDASKNVKFRFLNDEVIKVDDETIH